MDVASSLDEEEKEALAAAAVAIEAADRQLLLCAKCSCGEFLSPPSTKAVLCCGMFALCCSKYERWISTYRWDCFRSRSRSVSLCAFIRSMQAFCPIGICKINAQIIIVIFRTILMTNSYHWLKVVNLSDLDAGFFARAAVGFAFSHNSPSDFAFRFDIIEVKPRKPFLDEQDQAAQAASRKPQHASKPHKQAAEFFSLTSGLTGSITSFCNFNRRITTCHIT